MEASTYRCRLFLEWRVKMKNSVVQYLDIAAEKWPDSITFSDKKGKVTFSDYRLNALRIGTYLIN